jgi:hypothetical protein
LVKFDDTGDRKWTKQLGTNQAETAFSVTTDSGNNIYIVGSTGGDLDGNTSAGNNDVFLTMFDDSGNKILTKQYGTSDIDSASLVTKDTKNNIYVAGSTRGTFTGNSNPGGSNILIIKLSDVLVCNNSCFECSVQSDSCTSCSSNYFKKTEANFPTQCFNSPPIGYYLANSSYTRCDASCVGCINSPTTCTSCSPNYFKNRKLISLLNVPTLLQSVTTSFLPFI